MDADALAERCRIDLALMDEATGESGSVAALAWSSNGNWLAVQTEAYMPSLLTKMHGIHMHDAASGRHIQTLSLRGLWAHICWSCSLHKLAVHCEREGDADGDDGPGFNAPDTLRILDPALQIVAMLPGTIALRKSLAPNAVNRCYWAPCGSLLMLQLQERSVQVLNAATMKTIFATTSAADSISWGQLAPSGRPERSLVACMSDQGSRVRFCHARGEWQVVPEPSGGEVPGMSEVDA